MSALTLVLPNVPQALIYPSQQNFSQWYQDNTIYLPVQQVTMPVVLSSPVLTLFNCPLIATTMPIPQYPVFLSGPSDPTLNTFTNAASWMNEPVSIGSAVASNNSGVKVNATSVSQQETHGFNCQGHSGTAKPSFSTNVGLVNAHAGNFITGITDSKTHPMLPTNTLNPSFPYFLPSSAGHVPNAFLNVAPCCHGSSLNGFWGVPNNCMAKENKVGSTQEGRSGLNLHSSSSTTKPTANLNQQHVLDQIGPMYAMAANRSTSTFGQPSTTEPSSSTNQQRSWTNAGQVNAHAGDFTQGITDSKTHPMLPTNTSSPSFPYFLPCSAGQVPKAFLNAAPCSHGSSLNGSCSVPSSCVAKENMVGSAQEGRSGSNFQGDLSTTKPTASLNQLRASDLIESIKAMGANCSTATTGPNPYGHPISNLFNPSAFDQPLPFFTLERWLHAGLGKRVDPLNEKDATEGASTKCSGEGITAEYPLKFAPVNASQTSPEKTNYGLTTSAKDRVKKYRMLFREY